MVTKKESEIPNREFLLDLVDVFRKYKHNLPKYPRSDESPQMIPANGLLIQLIDNEIRITDYYGYFKFEI